MGGDEDRRDVEAGATEAADRERAGRGRRLRQRGQILVIFSLSIFVFIGLCGVVVDVAWYWANNLRMQRAADAAALAGVVWLPGDVPKADNAAYAEATKNGYTTGVNGYTVTPVQDPTNARRLVVTINGPVPTFFAHLFGINSFQASRTGKADYVLPVPMGSPQAYYGVGFYQGLQTTQTPNPGNTGLQGTTTPSGTGWTNPGNVAGNDNSYATASTSGSQQVWRTFGLLSGGSAIPNDPTLVIDHVEVALDDVSLTGSGTATDCHVGVQVTWNGGTNWSTVIPTNALSPTDPNDDQTVGAAPEPLSDWGGHTWARGDFSDSNFRVRLTWTNGTGGCVATRSVQLDQLRVLVDYHTVTTTTSQQVLSVPNPNGVGSLASQGFWGAMFTKGGVRENGDRYGPAYLGNGATGGGGNNSPNPDYDPNGYDYTVELNGGANGQVALFDPIFCATGPNSSGGWLGTGDHWTTYGPTGGTAIAPVGVTYRLYDTNNTPYNLADDTQMGAALTYDPGTHTLGDMSGAFGTPQNNGQGGAIDCSSNPAHNHWVTGWTGLPAGTYRLNVNTTLDPDNASVGAENLFSIWAGASGGSARVYGGGRMAAYTNLDETGAGGAQQFYFAQVEAVHAGKTMEITLFDPGEANAPSYLRFLSPQGGVYHYATFDWSSDDGRSGTGVTELQTSNGTPLFNNKIVTIDIALPVDYGASGLDPDGLGEDGWWKVEYDVRAGNDTTTWQVSIRGNPVHLVVP